MLKCANLIKLTYITYFVKFLISWQLVMSQSTWAKIWRSGIFLSLMIFKSRRIKGNQKICRNCVLDGANMVTPYSEQSFPNGFNFCVCNIVLCKTPWFLNKTCHRLVQFSSIGIILLKRQLMHQIPYELSSSYNCYDRFLEMIVIKKEPVTIILRRSLKTRPIQSFYLDRSERPRPN